MEFNYKLSADCVLESMKAVKKIQGKGIKIYIYSAIFLGLGIMWLVQFISGKEAINLFLSLFCISMLILIWYLPIKNQKQIAALSEEADKEFYICFSDECVYFNEEKTDFEPIENIEFLETENTVTLDVSMDRIFCLPKKYIEDIDSFRKIIVNKNYKDLRCLEESK